MDSSTFLPSEELKLMFLEREVSVWTQMRKVPIYSFCAENELAT